MTGVPFSDPRIAFRRALGANIAAARRARGARWSRRRLATRAGVAQSSLTYIESGEREPGAWTLARIASALGVTVDRLIPAGGAS